MPMRQVLRHQQARRASSRAVTSLPCGLQEYCETRGHTRGGGLAGAAPSRRRQAGAVTNAADTENHVTMTRVTSAEVLMPTVPPIDASAVVQTRSSSPARLRRPITGSRFPAPGERFSSSGRAGLKDGPTSPSWALGTLAPQLLSRVAARCPREAEDG